MSLDLNPLSGRNRVLAAVYTAAVLSNDQDMLAMYRLSYTPDELLEALEFQVAIMGRRIAVDSDRTLTEVGDSFVAAANVLQKMQDPQLSLEEQD